jgi:hypothetical protein
MFKSTKLHWIWTDHAEKVSKELGITRKAGDTVMERNNDGEYVKRQTVPLSWVEKGYVVEATEEQIELW